MAQGSANRSIGSSPKKYKKTPSGNICKVEVRKIDVIDLRNKIMSPINAYGKATQETKPKVHKSK
jgi:hypothetical protein